MFCYYEDCFSQEMIGICEFCQPTRYFCADHPPEIHMEKESNHRVMFLNEIEKNEIRQKIRSFQIEISKLVAEMQIDTQKIISALENACIQAIRELKIESKKYKTISQLKITTYRRKIRDLLFHQNLMLNQEIDEFDKQKIDQLYKNNHKLILMTKEFDSLKMKYDEMAQDFALSKQNNEMTIYKLKQDVIRKEGMIDSMLGELQSKDKVLNDAESLEKHLMTLKEKEKIEKEERRIKCKIIQFFKE